MATSGSNKRQRHSEDNDNTSSGMQLTDLPNSLISDVAAYLPQASCISLLYGLSSHDTTKALSKRLIQYQYSPLQQPHDPLFPILFCDILYRFLCPLTLGY